MSGWLIAGSHGVPTTPPLESAVDTNFQLFDGFEQLEVGQGWTGLGDEYGATPRPGGYSAQFRLEPGIPGKVGAVGATPLPVADCIHKPESEMATVYATPLTTQYNVGPGGASPGLDQSLYLQSVVDYLPSPDPLASFFGL